MAAGRGGRGGGRGERGGPGRGGKPGGPGGPGRGGKPGGPGGSGGPGGGGGRPGGAGGAGRGPGGAGRGAGGTGGRGAGGPGRGAGGPGRGSGRPGGPGGRGPGRRGRPQRDGGTPPRSEWGKPEPTPAPRREEPVREREAWTPPPDTMVLYGRNAVHEALRGPRTVQHVWATVSAATEPWLTAAAAGGEVDVNVVADAEWVERRSGSPDHQGVCAQVEAYRYVDAETLLEHPRPLIVALDEIQDPQNLGAIVRTAECAGATGVVIPERRSAEVTPAVCKASAGAVEHLPIARVRNLADFLVEARDAGAWCYGAEGDGGRPYTQVDYAGGGVVLVLGSEGRGLRPRVAASCDGLIALPLRGQIESLNVSAAASALVYEIVRQRDVADRAR